VCRARARPKLQNCDPTTGKSHARPNLRTSGMTNSAPSLTTTLWRANPISTLIHGGGSSPETHLSSTASATPPFRARAMKLPRPFSGQVSA
jgi:hypothetical protein